MASESKIADLYQLSDCGTNRDEHVFIPRGRKGLD